MAEKRLWPQYKDADGNMQDLKLDPASLASTSSEIALSSTNTSDNSVALNATNGGVNITAGTKLTVNTHVVKSVITGWTVDETAGTINITVEDLF